MKHLVRNDELKKRLFSEGEHENLTIYSCLFDSGRLAENVDSLRLGNDGMEIWIFPCYSCLQQITAYVLEPLFIRSRISDIEVFKKVHPLIAPFSRLINLLKKLK